MKNPNFSDPRIWQITALTTLLGFGVVLLEFSLSVDVVCVVITSALSAQFVISRGRFDPASALISALSLCLLLRTDSLPLAASAAYLAIFSKHLVRINGKHLFNPTAFALVVTATLFDSVWISPGQWGRGADLLILIVAAGTFVSTRAARLDTSITFLVVFAISVLARTIYLGDPFSIAFHQLGNGALLIFAFFMIPDPRTTPASRTGRLVFGAIVALGAAYIEFILYSPNGAVYALVFAAPLVPLLDRLLPGQLYSWPARTATTALSNHRLGVNHG